jgi:hypothetical protein
MNSKLYFKGHVKLTVMDAMTNEIIYEECQETDNLIVQNGYELLTDVLIGESTISYCGVGSGETEPTESDVNLETAIGDRKPVTTATRAGAIGLFSTFFSSADNNGTWNEAVLATQLSGDSTIISRALFDNTFIKSVDSTCVVDWTIEIGA